MDYYQGVVEEYLRADRSVFVNPEFCLQLTPNKSMPDKGTMWYVDLLAVDMRLKTVFFCEVTYANNLAALIKRLTAWAKYWAEISVVLERDACIPASFRKRPWVFVPADLIETFLCKFTLEVPKGAFIPAITPLEMVTPWSYCTWNRTGERGKEGYGIPPEMQFLDL